MLATLSVLLTLAVVLTGCGSSGNSGASTPAPITLSSIAVEPANQSIPVNGTHQFTASGTYSDGSSKDVTAQATWSSNKTSVATVNASGMVTAVASGTANITATVGTVNGSRSLTVTPILSSIVVAPASSTTVVNTTDQLTATGVWSDGSTQDLTVQVTWASADSTIASIDDSGMATGVAPGTSRMTATLGSIAGFTDLTVDAPTLTSIVITPNAASVPAGISQPFVATGVFNNGATQDLASATWGSTDSTIASVDGSGNATTVAAGTVTISATSGTVTGMTTFTVLPAALVSITLSPASPSLALGTTTQITATGLFTDGSTQILSVTWQTSDSTVATVDGNGNVTTVALGNVTLTATSGSINAQASLTVTPAVIASIAITPANPSIPAGFVQQFIATGTFTDGTKQDVTNTATWMSSTGSVATVSASGLASSLASGNSTITATLGLVSGSTNLQVTAAVLQSITVSPQSLLMTTGTTSQLMATGHYSDSSTQNLSSVAAWTSTDATIASVDSSGLVSGRQPGTVTITASSGGMNATTTVTVANHTLQAIIVTPVNPTVAAGQQLQFTATGYFADGTTQDLTKSAHWSSSASNVATVNSGQTGGGLCTPKAAGTATVTAAFNGISGSTTLTVN